jgi:hypothetical protein
LWSHYITKLEKSDYKIKYNETIIKTIDEETIKFFYANQNNNKKIEIFFEGSDFEKWITYGFEINSIMFLYIYNDEIKTTFYADIEFMRLGLPQWCGVL